MASLQPDLAEQCPGGVKLNRRSLGGLAFDIKFDENAAPPAATTCTTAAGGLDSPERKAASRGPPVSCSGGSQLSSEEIAERLAAAELRREQQLADRVGKLESKLSHVSEVAERRRREAEERAELNMKTVEETLKAAEERRIGLMEEVKQRVRGQSAGAKERREAMREQQAAARQSLEAELEQDIREKEARRREQLGRIVQGAQQHLARVEGVRSQRLSGVEILPDGDQ